MITLFHLRIVLLQKFQFRLWVQTTAISSAPVLQNSSPLTTHIKSPAHETEKKLQHMVFVSDPQSYKTYSTLVMSCLPITYFLRFGNSNPC
jgi:hypothetical protein